MHMLDRSCCTYVASRYAFYAFSRFRSLRFTKDGTVQAEMDHCQKHVVIQDAGCDDIDTCGDVVMQFWNEEKLVVLWDRA